MKLVLNIGMHKTGSSSIQESLAKFERNGAAYLQCGHPNHSGLHYTAFSNRPERYQSHVKNQRDVKEVARLRATYRERMASFCQEAKERGIHTLLSSGEDVSLLTPNSLKELRDFFAPFFSDILIVGYLRPPVSFMQSALQQRVVGGRRFELDLLYPHYRERFEKFDQVFGTDAVNLVKFDRADLHGGDVVLDFAHRAGVAIGEDEVVRANESRSLEATAILYAQRKLGRGLQSYPGSPRDNQRLAQNLSRIGSGRIRLKPALLEPILEANRDDLDWVEVRLGQPFSDSPQPHPQSIGSVEDLLEIAAEQMPALMRSIAQETPDARVEPELVARAVDLFHDILRNARESRPRGPGPAAHGRKMPD